MLNKFIRKRFNKWLKRRLPATNKITLNSANIFIFPSKTGLHFLITCFILFLLGTNYQNNLILFLVFFLCSFMVICLLLSYQNLAGLTLTAVNSEAQFADKNCQFNLRLSYSKTVAQDISFTFQKTTSKLHCSIDQDRVCLYAFSKRRGYFNPGRITVRSTFPFGLFTVWTHLDFAFKILLYPKPIENNMFIGRLSSDLSDKGMQASIMGVDEFSTLKNYQIGESLKSVAWKQLAQGRGWLTKQFEQSAGGDLLLDIDRVNHLPLEIRLRFLCYQVIALEKRGQRYALRLTKQQIEVGSGLEHKKRCLQCLALHERK